MPKIARSVMGYTVRWDLASPGKPGIHGCRQVPCKKAPKVLLYLSLELVIVHLRNTLGNSLDKVLALC